MMQKMQKMQKIRCKGLDAKIRCKNTLRVFIW
jgi:hypothetical protein